MWGTQEWSAAAGCVAALAAAASAWFSRQAARDNRRMAEQTREALGHMFAPDVQVTLAKRNTVHGHERGYAVRNLGDFAALDVRWTIQFFDRTTRKGHCDVLVPGATREDGWYPVDDVPRLGRTDIAIPVLSASVTYTDSHRAHEHLREWQLLERVELSDTPGLVNTVDRVTNRGPFSARD